MGLLRNLRMSEMEREIKKGKASRLGAPLPPSHYYGFKSSLVAQKYYLEDLRNGVLEFLIIYYVEDVGVVKYDFYRKG